MFWNEVLSFMEKKKGVIAPLKTMKNVRDKKMVMIAVNISGYNMHKNRWEDLEKRRR